MEIGLDAAKIRQEAIHSAVLQMTNTSREMAAWVKIMLTSLK